MDKKLQGRPWKSSPFLLEMAILVHGPVRWTRQPVVSPPTRLEDLSKSSEAAAERKRLRKKFFDSDLADGLSTEGQVLPPGSVLFTNVKSGHCYLLLNDFVMPQPQEAAPTTRDSFGLIELIPQRERRRVVPIVGTAEEKDPLEILLRRIYELQRKEE